MPVDLIFFYLFAAVAVAASVLVIAQRSPIYSVLLLIASFMALAGLYVLLDAPFLAVIQIVIYAGAIMVLFLFVVMLLNAPYEEPVASAAALEAIDATAGSGAGAAGGVRVWRWGLVLGAALAVEMLWTLWRSSGVQTAQAAAANPRSGEEISSVKEIGVVLFTEYAFAFEVTSILIIVAMVGAVVLAKREI